MSATILSQFQNKELKEIYKLTLIILSRNESFAFREKVDWESLGLIDYPEIVKQPMDLGTVKVNLEQGKYENVEDAAADIRLIWTNCMLYNSSGSEFYHLAEKFSRSFEDAYRAIRKLQDGELDPLRTPTLEEKLQLSHDIFKIGNFEIARVLTMLETDAPDAMALKRATEELLINFDAVPAKTFHEVNAYVLTCMAALTSSKKGGSSSNTNSKKRKSESFVL